MTDARMSIDAPPVQPLISDALIVLRAPTQVWSGRDGDVRADDPDRAIDGVFHGDVRYLREASLTYDGARPEWISASPESASRALFGGIMRRLDDPTPDPKVRVVRDRIVEAGSVSETISLRSHVGHPIETVLRVRLVPEFASLHDVKGGMAGPRAWSAEQGAARGAAPVVTVSSMDQSFAVTAPEASVEVTDDAITLVWSVRIPARGTVEVAWSVALEDPTLVVQGAASAIEWRPVSPAGTRDSNASGRSFEPQRASSSFRSSAQCFVIGTELIF